MLIDRSQRVWCWATLALLAVASGAYLIYARTALDGPRGGSLPGLIFGIVGSALMIYAGLISARKKAPTWRIGSAQTWLRGHLWLGSLSIPLILFHAGFRWGGPVEQALLAVLAAIVASGVFGLLLQQFLPRQMTSRVPLETFYAQVPHVCRVLEVEADVAVAQLCGPLPLAVSPDDPVATVERLNLLGVSGRNPQTSVYAAPGDAAAPAAPAAMPKPATQEVREVIEPPKPKPAAKAASAADKIAMMRAAKAAKPTGDGAADAATTEKSAAAVAEAPAKPNAALSAADKIAMMRAAKVTKKPDETPVEVATQRPAPAETEAPAKPKAALSAADKIALMRAAKATKKPDEAPAEAETQMPAPAKTEAPAKPKAALSAADKIALMRAAKTTKKPDEPHAEADTQTAAPAEIEAPAKPKAALSAADKIAMMRAAKAAQKPEDGPAAPAAANAPPAKPTSAAEKIALMRAGKAALAGNAAGADAAATSTTVSPVKPTPTKPAPIKPAAGKPVLAKTTPGAPRKKPAEADDWKQACPEFVRFYLDQVRPFLGAGYLRQSLLADGVQAEGQFAAIGAVLPEPLQPVIARLASLCEERRQLATQVRIHHWLHGWLLLHVPLSVALLVLGVVHVVASLYY